MACQASGALRAGTHRAVVDLGLERGWVADERRGARAVSQRGVRVEVVAAGARALGGAVDASCKALAVQLEACRFAAVASHGRRAGGDARLARKRELPDKALTRRLRSRRDQQVGLEHGGQVRAQIAQQPGLERREPDSVVVEGAAPHGGRGLHPCR
jgi:hypothetical protein